MDDNGSFDESFNFYSNAVSRLQDSDDEDLACVTVKEPSGKAEELSEKTEAPKIDAVPAKVSLPITDRQTRRQQQRKCCSPMNTRGWKRGRGKGRGQGRPRRGRSASIQSSQSFELSNSEILDIVELSGDSIPTPSPPVTNYEDFAADEGEIVWDSAKTTENILAKTSEDTLIDVSSELDEPILGLVEEDLEVSIHVKWRIGSKHFSLKKSDRMKEIFKHFTESEGVPENQISLTLNGKPIYPNDTAENFQSTVVILEGSVKAVSDTVNQPPEEVDPNQIELKVLMKDKKDKPSIFILRSEPLEVFMEKTAVLTGIPRSQLLCKIDGDTLDSSETPESLDLEAGECIEVVVRS